MPTRADQRFKALKCTSAAHSLATLSKVYTSDGHAGKPFLEDPIFAHISRKNLVYKKSESYIIVYLLFLKSVV